MDLRDALYTTRAMRRVRPDPIPLEVQARILDAAIRAPSGGNAQAWRFVLVDSPELKSELGPLYRDSIAKLWETIYKDQLAKAAATPESAASIGMLKVQRSAQWLADHYEEVPLFLFAFSRNDPSGGSIYPAVWSAQLAARAEGVGSALTSVLGFFHGDEVRRLFVVPDAGWMIASMVSFGYPKGRWAVARRRPVDEVAARNRWDGELGFSVPEPLWGLADKEE
ncbi:MAG TPA: nitroreductase family protein [Acidimicrobiales bacterium]|nr:nitroreductase family protein [Acidimicrobiales bacterium]